jgi:hypothetical protein
VDAQPAAPHRGGAGGAAPPKTDGFPPVEATDGPWPRARKNSPPDRPVAARGQSPSLAFGHPKSCAFHGSRAPGTSSMRCSRLFVHSLQAARGQSPSLAFGHPKSCAFHGSRAPGTSSMRCSRLFVHSLQGWPPRRGPQGGGRKRIGYRNKPFHGKRPAETARTKRRRGRRRAPPPSYGSSVVWLRDRSESPAGLSSGSTRA